MKLWVILLSLIIISMSLSAQTTPEPQIQIEPLSTTSSVTNEDIAMAILQGAAIYDGGRLVNFDSAVLYDNIMIALKHKDDNTINVENRWKADNLLLQDQVNYNGQLALNYQKLVEAYKAIKTKNWGLSFGAGLDNWQPSFNVGFLLLF